MDWLKNKLAGWKTYLAGAAAIIGAVAAYAANEITFYQAAVAAWAGITAMFMRAGIKKAS